jgi:ABC-type phosphate transport system substrate-binding protein
MTCRTSVFILVFPLLSILCAQGAHGDEALAVIVNKSNPVENMTLDELRKYCVQERKRWDDNTRVTVVLRDPGQAEREAVLQLIYKMGESDFKRYFLQAEFTGEVQTAPKHLFTGLGVRRFVFNVPGAIGFVRASEVDTATKVLRVNGHSPSDPDYPLRLKTR